MSEGMTPFGERRLFERKSCSRIVSVYDFKDSFAGMMSDLTLGGAFIEPSGGGGAFIGQELELTIPFATRHDHLKIKAKVAWTRPNGIGVRFIQRPCENRSFFQ